MHIKATLILAACIACTPALALEQDAGKNPPSKMIGDDPIHVSVVVDKEHSTVCYVPMVENIANHLVPAGGIFCVRYAGVGDEHAER